MKICLQVAQNTRSLPPITIIDMSPNQHLINNLLVEQDVVVVEQDVVGVEQDVEQGLVQDVVDVEDLGAEAEGELVDMPYGMTPKHQIPGSFLRGASHTSFALHVCHPVELIKTTRVTSDFPTILAPTSDAALDATVEEVAAVKAALCDHLELIGRLDKVTGEVIKNEAGEFSVGYTGQSSQAPVRKAPTIKKQLGYEGILRKINVKKYGIVLTKYNISKFEAILNKVIVDPDCPNSA